ncbi:MAG: amino acid permease [Oligoflexales bacterium]
MENLGRILGSIFLLAGTAIGAAMLALPISTGILGLYPSLCLFVLSWFALLYSAYLFLELTLWSEGEVNIVTMASIILGPSGKIICWSFYLYLLYALVTAYIAGGGLVVANFLQAIGFNDISLPLASLGVCLVLGFLVMKGIFIVDMFNRVFMLVLFCSLISLIAMLSMHIEPNNFKQMSFDFLPNASSVVITSFGFHIVIPSLCTYLKHNVSQLKKVLLIGSSMPLVFYIVWEVVTLGTVPIEGSHGLRQAYEQGIPISSLLQFIGADGQEETISILAMVFSLLAIFTSFFGVGVSLIDFLKDGLKLSNDIKSQAICFILGFLVPLVIALLNPQAFLRGLEYAGAFGVVTLLMVLPAVMVWVGRYHKGFSGPYKAPGGKLILGTYIFFSWGFIFLEIINKLA